MVLKARATKTNWLGGKLQLIIFLSCAWFAGTGYFGKSVTAVSDQTSFL
jgi:hypothetical protein